MDFNPRWSTHLVRAFYRLIGFRFVWTRWALPFVLNATGLTGEGAGIGVLSSSFSAYLLRYWKGKTLYSVDPWRNFGAGEYVDVNHDSDQNFEEIYRPAFETLAPFGERSKILRQASSRAPRGSPVASWISFLWTPNITTKEQRRILRHGGRKFAPEAYSPGTMVSTESSRKAISE